MLLATHFVPVAKYLDAAFPCVTVLNMTVDEEDTSAAVNYANGKNGGAGVVGGGRLSCNYSLGPGVTPITDYGLRVAEQMPGMPRQLSHWAKQAKDQIDASRGQDSRLAGVRGVLLKRKLLLQFALKIKVIEEKSELRAEERDLLFDGLAKELRLALNE